MQFGFQFEFVFEFQIEFECLFQFQVDCEFGMAIRYRYIVMLELARLKNESKYQAYLHSFVHSLGLRGMRLHTPR